MAARERQRELWRRRGRRYREKHHEDPVFRERQRVDAARRRARRDPNFARDYQRERRFRFTRESTYDREMKDAGLSIVSEMEIKAGLFIFEIHGSRTRERLGEALPEWQREEDRCVV